MVDTITAGAAVRNDRTLSDRRSVLLLIFITVALLLPFVNKAFHADDPLFVWVARQIQSHPLNPFGFDVNWYYNNEPISGVTKNPPLTPYFIALIGSMFGWKETTLHIAFLFPAIAVVLGTFFIARKLCPNPLIAGLFILATPVFLISSTTVMCDIMMLAFWVWAVFFWIEGIRKDDHRMLFLAAVSTSLCVLTKYYGITLLILLPVYAFLKKRRMGAWSFYLALPAAVLFLYQWATSARYGTGLLSSAVSFASVNQMGAGSQFIPKMLIGLSFTGGCLAATIFYVPFLWSRKAMIFQVTGLAIFMLVLSYTDKIGNYPLRNNHTILWPLLLQLSVFVFTGVNLLALAVKDLRESRMTAESVLLFCWVAGTLIFASFINWSINARSVLPMAPAAGMILSRALKSASPHRYRNVFPFLPLVPAAIIALMLARVDYVLANSARKAADIIYSGYGEKGLKVWFEGHFGFQYYMEEKGFRLPLHPKAHISPGEILVIPENNMNLFYLPPDTGLALKESIKLPVCRWASTANGYVWAGFYWADFPLPFAAGGCPNERYNVIEVGLERAGGPAGKENEDIDGYSGQLSHIYYDDPMGFKPTVERSKLFTSRGDAYCKIGKYDRAISDYVQALISYPYVPKIYYSRSIAYFLNSEYKRARDDAARVRGLGMKMDPQFLEKLRTMAGGVALKAAKATGAGGSPEGIGPAPGAARKTGPDDIDKARELNSVGAIKGKIGDLDGAIRLFNEATLAAPNYSDSYNNLGYAHYKKGDYARAEECFKKAVELDPGNQKARSNLERIQKNKT